MEKTVSLWKERFSVKNKELKLVKRKIKKMTLIQGKAASSEKVALWNQNWQRKMDAILNDKRELEEKNEQQKKLIHDLETALLSKSSYVILSRVKNLGSGFELRTVFENLVFIDDPSIFSKSSLEKLSRKSPVLVSRKPFPRPVSKKFLVLRVEDVDLRIFKRFVLIKRYDLDQVKKKQGVLKQVVDQYKESRQVRR
jgi:hypothetical protein